MRIYTNTDYILFQLIPEKYPGASSMDYCVFGLLNKTFSKSKPTASEELLKVMELNKNQYFWKFNGKPFYHGSHNQTLAITRALLGTEFLRGTKVFHHVLGPPSGAVVTLRTGRREEPGSNTGRACRPSCSEFSVVFSETRVNTG